MSVVSGKIVFCEGIPTSLDSLLLNRLLDKISGERVTIVGSGGKFTFSVFATGYFAQRGTANQPYLVFRDRDFDRRPSGNIQLLEFGRLPMFLTHRACIENYLLDAALIHAYWTEGSGRLPELLSFSACHDEAVILIEQFRQAIKSITKEAFEARLTHYRTQFDQSEFWEEKQYFIWFHGKDLQKAMQQQNAQYISLKNFFKWAVTRIDFTQHADLNELRAKIEQL